MSRNEAVEQVRELFGLDGSDTSPAEADVRTQTDTLVGQRVADTLRRHGLNVSWSGSPTQRIAISIDSWRKPLPA